jgi:dihydroorotase
VISKCGWTPYHGRKIKGWPIMTIRNGEIMMKDGKIISESLGKEIILDSKFY